MISLLTSRDRDVYLDFAELKVLVARILVTLHLDAPLPSTGTRLLHQHHSVRSAGIQRACSVRNVRNNELRLDAHLRAVLTALEGEMPPGAAATSEGDSEVQTGDDELKARIERLKAEIGRIDCETCAAKASRRPCNGRWQDGKIQRGNARCLDHLRGLFEFAVAVGNRAYAAVPHSGGDKAITVGLKTLPGRDLKVNAATHFPPDDHAAARAADVSIWLPAEKFEIANYYQTLYGLLHEVIVHAPQTLGIAGSRVPQGDDCPFSEGFIDSAAVQAFLAAIDDAASLPEPQREQVGHLDHVGLTARLRDGVMKEHGDRTDPDRIPPTMPFDPTAERERTILGQRWSGRQTFQKLGGFAGLVDEAISDAATRLALAINLLDLDRDKRLQFIRMLEQALTRDAARLTRKDLERKRAVQRFCRYGDLDSVLTAFNLT